MLAIAPAAAAQDVPQLSVGRLADGEGPEIDGRADDPVWSRAQPYTTFIQQEPNEGQPATERTDVRFLVDRATLYIAVICFDTSPGDIVVSESRRDASLADTDSIEIWCRAAIRSTACRRPASSTASACRPAAT